MVFRQYSDRTPSKCTPTDFSLVSLTLTSDEITNHSPTFLAMVFVDFLTKPGVYIRHRKFTLTALARASERTLRVCIHIRMYIFAELKHVVHAGPFVDVCLSVAY